MSNPEIKFMRLVPWTMVDNAIANHVTGVVTDDAAPHNVPLTAPIPFPDICRGDGIGFKLVEKTG